MRVLKPALVYVGLVFAAGFALGVVRTLAVVPRVGDRAAELLEIPLMLAAIVLAARWTTRRVARGLGPAARLAVGLIALALMLAAEMAVGVLVRGLSPGESLVHRDPVTGTLYYASLLVFAVLPCWLGRTGDGQ
jgi:hypothetical protein